MDHARACAAICEQSTRYAILAGGRIHTHDHVSGVNGSAERVHGGRVADDDDAAAIELARAVRWCCCVRNPSADILWHCARSSSSTNLHVERLQRLAAE